MICVVVGKLKKPYEVTDERGRTKSGISCRLSLSVAPYENDPSNGVFGEGEQFVEYRCPENIVDAVDLGNTLSVELDDKKTRIKSAMIKVGENSFMPID